MEPEQLCCEEFTCFHQDTRSSIDLGAKSIERTKQGLKSVTVLSDRTLKIIALGISLSLALIVLLPSLDNELVSDDLVFVYQGIVAESPGTVFEKVPEGWFSRPVVWVVSYFLAKAFGTEPLGYRVVIMLLHCTNAFLLGLLAFQLLDRRRSTDARVEDAEKVWLGAIGVSTLFLVYSLSHEVIYWYSSITECLAIFFRFSCLALAFHYFRNPNAGIWRLSQLSFSVFALSTLALLSKESAVVLPLELAVLAAVYHWTHVKDSSVAELRSAARMAMAAVASSSIVTICWYWWYTGIGMQRTDLTILELGPGGWLLRLGLALWRSIAFGFMPDTAPVILLLLGVGAAVFLYSIIRRQLAASFGLLWLCLCLLPYVAITSTSDKESGTPVLERMTGIAEGRYYYGAGAAVALVTVALGFSALRELERSSLRILHGLRPIKLANWTLVLLVSMLASGQAVRLLLFERDWDHAGDIVRDARLELGEKLESYDQPGGYVCITGRPDHYRGRFILRSGIEELAFLSTGRNDFTVLVPPFANESVCTIMVRLEAGATAIRVDSF